ncbi:MAG: class I SAM-dependent methyltransferase [Nitrospinota bacterium]|nr:class I SAM-dependent methyltransferase [Nitrospinota bacterium]
MKQMMMAMIPIFDVALYLLIYPAAILLKIVRRIGVQRLPFCKKALLHVGVFPIRNHFYEPLFDHRQLKNSLFQDRELPGIDFNVGAQLDLLNSFNYSEELKKFPLDAKGELSYFYKNGNFEFGDAEYWYSLIRIKKPRRIIEIGSGSSTLMAIAAVKKNQQEMPSYKCDHICIEPFGAPWLEKTGVSVVRKKVEDVGKDIFLDLKEDDILFIDSSHIIRPQGDVLFEYLELLPILNKGVIVHFHDIFSPKDYPENWVVNKVHFWNEQYLLEAFLTMNSDWEVICSLNYLRHHHFEELKSRCPFLTVSTEPGSFYIRKKN